MTRYLLVTFCVIGVHCAKSQTSAPGKDTRGAHQPTAPTDADRSGGVMTPAPGTGNATITLMPGELLALAEALGIDIGSEYGSQAGAGLVNQLVKRLSAHRNDQNWDIFVSRVRAEVKP